MRILVQCPSCGRQYDAGAKTPGDKFRCLCGKLLVVPPVKPRDASVVRCSSCGAPREEGTDHCGYCGADFTVHEQDLQTVCPRCFARISNRAHYCHHCGQHLVVEHIAGERTELPCPVCGPELLLTNRTMEGAALMECRKCGGMWLGHATLQMLVEKAAKEAKPVSDRRPRLHPVHAGQSRVRGRSGPLYRKCPICGNLMNRKNYAGRSGVVVDVCRDHGVWFDAEELGAIINWIREGGLVAAQAALEEQRQRERRKDSPKRQAKDWPLEPCDWRAFELLLLDEFWVWLGRAIGRLFRL